MQPAAAWLTGALVALVAELFTGTFALLMVGFAASGAALAALLGGDVVAWPVFIALALIGLILVRPWAVRRWRGAGTRTNVDALLGETAQLVLPFDPASGIGRVRAGGLEWRARLAEGAEPPDPADAASTILWIQEVRGTTLTVLPMPPVGPAASGAAARTAGDTAARREGQ